MDRWKEGYVGRGGVGRREEEEGCLAGKIM